GPVGPTGSPRARPVPSGALALQGLQALGGLLGVELAALEQVEHLGTLLAHVGLRLVAERQQQLLEAQPDRRVAQAEDPLDLLEVAPDLDEDAQELEVLLRQHRELVGREAPLDRDAALLALEAGDEERAAGHGALGRHGEHGHQMTSTVMWVVSSLSGSLASTSTILPSGIVSTVSRSWLTSMPCFSSSRRASLGTKRRANFASA